MLATGYDHTCSLNGVVECWGRNDQGELGRGTTSISETAPAVVTGEGGYDATAGDGRACTLQGDRTVHCWGGQRPG